MDWERKMEEMARQLLGEHGLTEQGWSFEWDRAMTSLGSCSHGRRVITMSKPLAKVNTADEMMDTLLHEIAHALVGPQVGHGREWRSMARKLGAKLDRVAHAAVAVPAPWQGTCPACGELVERYRLTQRTRESACEACCRMHNGGRWSARYVFVWKRMDRRKGDR